MNHTPGPWKVSPQEHWGGDGMPIKAGALTVAVALDDVAELEDQYKANAHFIVTACNSHYALLEALESVLASVPFASYRGDGELEECEARVRAAINKAKGGHHV